MKEILIKENSKSELYITLYYKDQKGKIIQYDYLTPEQAVKIWKDNARNNYENKPYKMFINEHPSPVDYGMLVDLAKTYKKNSSRVPHPALARLIQEGASANEFFKQLMWEAGLTEYLHKPVKDLKTQRKISKILDRAIALSTRYSKNSTSKEIDQCRKKIREYEKEEHGEIPITYYRRAANGIGFEKDGFRLVEYDENDKGEPTIAIYKPSENIEFYLTLTKSGWKITGKEKPTTRKVDSILIALAERFEKSKVFQQHYN